MQQGTSPKAAAVTVGASAAVTERTAPACTRRSAASTLLLPLLLPRRCGTVQAFSAAIWKTLPFQGLPRCPALGADISSPQSLRFLEGGAKLVSCPLIRTELDAYGELAFPSRPCLAASRNAVEVFRLRQLRWHTILALLQPCRLSLNARKR